jgi:phosphoesterase family protein
MLRQVGWHGPVSAVGAARSRARLVKPRTPIELRAAAVHAFGAVRFTRWLAASLLLLGALACATATNALGATTVAKPAHAVVVRIALRTAGVYEVRVTVSSRSARKNRVDIQIGSPRRNLATATVSASRGQQARISIPVRIASRSLTVRAIGGRSKPTLKVLKWLIAPMRVGPANGSAGPVGHSKPGVARPQGKTNPVGQRPPMAAVIVKRIRRPGIYAVHIGISSRTASRNHVRLQIGSLARHAFTTGRRHASMVVRIALAHRSLTVRATGDRSQPTLTISLHRLAPLEPPASAPAPAPTPPAAVPPTPAVAPATASAPYSHVVIAVEENYDGAALVGGSSAPYIASLAAQGEYFPNYHAVSHPSEPNYMALFSGSTQGTDGSDNCISTAAESIVGDGAASGVTVRGYVEGLASGTLYACRHDPFSQFTDATSSETDFANFPTDYSTLPAISFVVPNTVDDMHDSGIAAGDSWAQAQLDGYAQWAKTHNSLLIIVSDENDADPNYNANQPGENGNTALAVMVGAGITPGTVDNTVYDHYSMLRTLEDLFGLGHLGASATAVDMITG